ncbi:MAG: hypothetical protein DRO40_09780 [Thermoprotei archaeon]|nr:MAG: hypothetical protein DRO40_09780 [Thermoprotei archaeon]
MDGIQALITLSSTAGLGVVLSIFFARFITKTLYAEIRELRKAIEKLIETVIRMDERISERDMAIKQTLDLIIQLLRNNNDKRS